MSDFTRPGNLNSQTSNEAEMEDVVNKMLELEQSQGSVINREGEVGQIQEDIIKESNLIASELKSDQLANTGTQATNLNNDESLDSSQKPNSADLSTISDLNLEQAAMLDESIPNETVQALLSLPDSLPAIPYTQSIPKERQIEEPHPPVLEIAIEASIGDIVEDLKDQKTVESPLKRDAAQLQIDQRPVESIEEMPQESQVVAETNKIEFDSPELADPLEKEEREVADVKPNDTIEESQEEQEAPKMELVEETAQVQEKSIGEDEVTAPDRDNDCHDAVETLIDLSETLNKSCCNSGEVGRHEPVDTIDEPQEKSLAKQSIDDQSHVDQPNTETPMEDAAGQQEAFKVVEDVASDSDYAVEAQAATSATVDKDVAPNEDESANDEPTKTVDEPMKAIDEPQDEQTEEPAVDDSVQLMQPNVSRPKRTSREKAKPVQKKTPEKRAPKVSVRPPRATRQTMTAITTPKTSKATIPATEPRKKTSGSTANYELKRYFCDTCQYGTDRLNNIIYHMKLSCVGTQRRYAESVAEWKLELQSPKSNSKKATR